MPLRSIINLAALLLTLAAPLAYAQPTPRPDEARTIGQVVPDVELTDDSGRVFALDSLAGKPVILSPVFTRCPHACQAITSSLRENLLAIGPPGDSYNVVTLTFDPADSLEVLREFRRNHDLPPAWIVARAEPAALDTLLGAIDFNYSPVAGGGFLHANIVAILTPDLRVSGYVYGIGYTEDELRQALLSAVTPDSLVDAFKPLIAAVAALGLLVTLVVLWATRKRQGNTA
jgi:cytochrome oxidase Cu insertion factor (SCO1/SenC/PrrC family)